MLALLVRWLYSLALWLLTPVYLVRVWWRGRAEPAYRKRLRERLGRYALPPRRGQGGVVWVHAVSLGETRAAAPLVQALRNELPQMRLLLTCSTATGVAAGHDLLHPEDDQTWFPYDTPGAVRRFLKRYRPAVGVIMETEVWPNLMHAARNAQVPMVLANARLSAKSQRKGRRLDTLLRPALASFNRVLAQTPRDAQRLRESGAKPVEVCGNTKFDITPPTPLLARGRQWRQAVPRTVVLMAVSREGEDQPLLDAWRALPEPRPLLVIVPRHPQRFDEIAALIERNGFSVQRRSSWGDTPPPAAGESDIWLGDSMGEMPLYYAMADVALLGGSFAPLGGQNLIEAAACGCPLVLGPHTFNFEDAAQLAIEAGAAVRMDENPDGFSWMEALLDETKIGCHVALTPTWSETSWYADYVLPMGLGSERHDLASFETHSGRWLGFRQPVMRRYAELQGEEIGPDRRTFEFNGRINGGEVWEENEFWVDLSWRVDPDGSLGVREHFESIDRPGTPMGVDEYYGRIFAEQVPGLADDAAQAGATPLEYMRDRAAYAVPGDMYEPYERLVDAAEVEGCTRRADGVFVRPGTSAAWNGDPEQLSTTLLAKLGDGTPAVEVDGELRAGFPTPSMKLELFSTTLEEWGWPEHATPGWIPSHVHWEHLDLAGNERILMPTFRIPTLVHTRSGNSKWLNEISHRHPLWIHPSDVEALGIEESGLVRISTRIGHFVIAAWRTEGIRPGVVAASHHMGRWRVEDDQARSWSAGKARIAHDGSQWRLTREHGMQGWESDDPDTQRIWWHDTGVHQNLTFAVQPDPISGMHCWHQRVRVEPALPDDRYGDVVVDTAKCREAYLEWLATTRPAPGPNGLRRPLWYARPLKPVAAAYLLAE